MINKKMHIVRLNKAIVMAVDHVEKLFEWKSRSWPDMVFTIPDIDQVIQRLDGWGRGGLAPFSVENSKSLIMYRLKILDDMGVLNATFCQDTTKVQLTEYGRSLCRAVKGTVKDIDWNKGLLEEGSRYIHADTSLRSSPMGLQDAVVRFHATSGDSDEALTRAFQNALRVLREQDVAGSFNVQIVADIKRKHGKPSIQETYEQKRTARIGKES